MTFYFQALDAAGIPQGKGTYEKDASIAELYGAVIEQEHDEPVSGLLDGVGRDLMILGMALENPAVEPSALTVARKLADLTLRVELALELHRRILAKLAGVTSANEEGQVVP